jgi:vancomycin aglycone glucosyltransferase
LITFDHYSTLQDCLLAAAPVSSPAFGHAVMRVLLSTIGSRGDVQPLVALALQLKTLSQDVRLCVPPDFQPWIAELGLPVTTIGPELRRMTAARPQTAATPLSPEQRRQLAEASVAAQFDTIATAAEGCDVIVAATALQIAARSVSEKLGIRYVFAAYCPIVLPSPHHAPPPMPPLPGEVTLPPSAGNTERWARDTERFNNLFGPSLNAHRTTLGLPPVSDVRAHIFAEQPLLAADATLAPWPDPADGSVRQTGAWLLPDERSLSRELNTFLDAGEPPLYFGLGSIRAPNEDVARAMLESARAVGRRAIISRGWADLTLVDDASDWLSVGEVNQQALFPRLAAVVHHGGAGTTTAAALAGAPQAVIPQVFDQYYWAERVERLGIGTAHEPGAPTIESLTQALERTLRADVAGRAAALAALIRRDGAAVAAQNVIN